MAKRISQRKITNKRLCPRYDFHVGISLKSNFSYLDGWSPALSQNLSQSGLHLMHSKILVPDEPVSIKIPLFSTSEMITLSGVVSWVGIDDLFEDSPFWVTAGIQFNDLKSSELRMIGNALSNRDMLDGLPVKKISNKIDFVM